MYKKTIFFSYSFNPNSTSIIGDFRDILKTSIEEIRRESSKSGAILNIDIVECSSADSGNPISYIFPKIKNCDMLIALILNEFVPIKINSLPEQNIKAPFVSASCLQETILAYSYGKKILVWIEGGANKIGFINNITTYRNFQDLSNPDEKKRVIKNIKTNIINIFQPSLGRDYECLYDNQFEPNIGNRVIKYSWQNKSTGNIGDGGQYEIPNCSEHNGRGLMIVDTEHNWNWSNKKSNSIATLAKLDKRYFKNGQEVIFEFRCKSTGTVRIKPLIQGPAKDPSDLNNKSLWKYDLAEWEYQTIAPEEGWISRVFEGNIQYEEKLTLPAKITLYLVTNTENHLLFVERILFGIKK